MMKRVQEQGGQAVYMRTMTAMASPQHTVRFDVDETVLKKGAVILLPLYMICLERAKSNGEKLKWRFKNADLAQTISVLKTTV